MCLGGDANWHRIDIGHLIYQHMRESYVPWTITTGLKGSRLTLHYNLVSMVLADIEEKVHRCKNSSGSTL